MERTDVLPPRAQAEQGAPRDVSIEELIDLEQQAEFFVVLGQDEAAVDLWWNTCAPPAVAARCPI
jgi:pilus assembly protein FimV